MVSMDHPNNVDSSFVGCAHSHFSLIYFIRKAFLTIFFSMCNDMDIISRTEKKKKNCNILSRNLNNKRVKKKIVAKIWFLNFFTWLLFNIRIFGMQTTNYQTGCHRFCGSKKKKILLLLILCTSSSSYVC